jgi:branched-subunit amino acid ABC-type transport system permease component
MKRVALIFAVMAVLLFADGLCMVLANYHPGDANTFFGNQTWNISDGEVTLISAGFLALAAAILWLVVVRRDARSRAQRPGSDPAKAEQPGSRTAFPA